MNSLNILSSRVIGQTSPSSPTRHRSRSQGEIQPGSHRSDLAKGRSLSEERIAKSALHHDDEKGQSDSTDDPEQSASLDRLLGEKTPLLHELQLDGTLPLTGKLFWIAQRLYNALTETLKAVLSTLLAPGIYVARCFRDDQGFYSPLAPVRKIRRALSGSKDISASARGTRMSAQGKNSGKVADRVSVRRNSSARTSRSSTTRESASSESETDRRALKHSGSVSRHTRSKSYNPGQEVDESTPRRSIRIKLHNEVAQKRSAERRSQSESLGQHSSGNGDGSSSASLALDSLKSPTSPSSHKITKYPHAPAPPRPLIPPRQPSYTAGPLTRDNSRLAQKTLVLDLDETLIHSLAKGGRMSSGHMVEVKLATPVTTSAAPGGPPTVVGPQHPILYYVHKRPHCDDFLRQVCKWYKLVVFTASVQEYADPVIDWLEQERKYFQGRYYRQHCTLRNGAYIKDLSSVEPDLSKVMILDNSPMSYIFHEDNAIPIEGWISDPTDNDLLHLIPMLEALQYVTDVRAFLALRRGEVQTS